MKRATKSVLSVFFALAMLLCMTPVSAFATTTPTAAATGAAGGATTYSGEYHAYLGFQTNTKLWIFRNAWGDSKEKYGHDSDAFKHGLCSVKEGKITEYAGTFTDAVVDGDGTYTVKLDKPELKDETSMSQLFVSSDIPMSDSIKVSNVIVKMNDSTLYTFADGILNPESKEYAQIMCQNIWNKDVTDLFTYTLPFDTCSITFTIKGMGYESKTANATPTVAAVATTAPAGDADSDSTSGGVNKGVVIGIVAAVVVVVIIVIVAVSKKKKK